MKRKGSYGKKKTPVVESKNFELEDANSGEELKMRRRPPSDPNEVVKVRRPKRNEIYGHVVAMLGASRLKANCLDGKERIVRIPGKMKRQAWIKSGDIILLIPWEIDNNKADVTWRFTRIQVEWLKRKGFLPEEFGE